MTSSVNGAGSGGLSYLDRLRQVQKQEETSKEKTTGSKQLGQDEFLKLLTQQLSQQDPSKPVDNDQMISQMTSFSMLTGVNQITKELETLSSSITSSQALQASSLVGKKVLINTPTIAKTTPGTEQVVINVPKAASHSSLRITNQNGELVKTMQIGDLQAGNQRFVWSGMDEAGKALPPGYYTVKVSGKIDGKQCELPVSTFSNVDSVSLASPDGKSGVMLNIAGMSKPIRLSDVKEIG